MRSMTQRSSHSSPHPVPLPVGEGESRFLSKSHFSFVFAALFACTALGQSTKPAEFSAPNNLAGKSFLTLPGDEWKLIFHDEFNSSALDDTKWTSALTWRGDDGSGRHHNAEYASYITDDNIVLRDGQLHLLTRKQDVTNPRGKVYHYTQAFIQTDGKFAYAYGYCEVRVKVPIEAGAGLWPAFWMLSRGWPPEDDVAEFWTGRPLPHTHQGYAFRESGDRRVKWESTHKDAILDGFHTFGMEWGPGYQIFNRDGAVTLRVFGREVPGVPMYLILNSGVAANPPPPEKTVFPNAFDIDYVRVYARPQVPALHDGGFESDSLAPWSTRKGASVVTTNAHSGKRALQLNADASVEQTAFGLKPATVYRITAWIDAGGDEVRAGVRDFGADEKFAVGNGNGYRPISIEFTTGHDATSATIYFTKTAGKAPAFVDDIAIAALP
jgi:beta-glucanase (GH16 family)